MFGFGAHGLFIGLAQLLVALVGAIIIAAAIHGFRAEWKAMFKRPFGPVPTRILVYLVSGFFQYYNGMVHGVPRWEIPILALLTAFGATGIYHFAKKRQAE